MNAVGKIEPRRVYLGLGSNIDPESNLPRGLALLGQKVQILALSSTWETPPAGGRGPNFLNAVALALTELEPEPLRREVLRPIEARLGRVRTDDPNAPRPFDIDILVVEREVLDPEIWERAYKAIPLAELLPDLRHPLSGELLEAVARRLRLESAIQRCGSLRLEIG